MQRGGVTENRTQPLKILVIDDNRADVHLLEVVLRQIGVNFEATVFLDGEEALSALPAYARRPAPDFILLDLIMPRVGGLEVLKEIRRMPCFERVPLYVITSSHDPEHRREAESFDRTRFVSKPITLDEIGRLVEGILSDLGYPARFTSSQTKRVSNRAS